MQKDCNNALHLNRKWASFFSLTFLCYIVLWYTAAPGPPVISDTHAVCLVDGKQEVHWHHCPAFPCGNLIWLNRSNPFLLFINLFISFAQNPYPSLSEWTRFECRLESDKNIRSPSLRLSFLSVGLHPFLIASFSLCPVPNQIFIASNKVECIHWAQNKPRKEDSRWSPGSCEPAPLRCWLINGWWL